MRFLEVLPEQTALGYIVDPDGTWRTNVFGLPIIGASDGSMFSTAGDLARLWDAFWNHQILSEAMVDVYVRPHAAALTEGPHQYYGCGIWIYDDADRDHEYYIIGCDQGASMKSGWRREADLQVTVVSNTSHGARAVADTIDRRLGRVDGS